MTKLYLMSDEKIRNENGRKNEKETKKWKGNQIGNEGAKSLSESLKINTSLTELYLESDEKGEEMKRMNKEIMKKCAGNRISEETKKLLGIWWQQYCSLL